MQGISFTEEEVNAWKNAGPLELPEGIYKGKLIKAEIGFFGKNNRKNIVLTYSVSDPIDFLGCVHKHFLPLDNVKMMWLTKKNCEALGISKDTKLEDLEFSLKKQVGIMVTFEIETRDQYKNTNVLTIDVINEDDIPDFNQ